MRKSNHFLFLILFSILGIASYSQTCNPVLTYNTSFDLCEGNGSLDMTVSAALPLGCAYQNPVTPFTWIGTGAGGNSAKNTASVSNPQGSYSVQVNIVQSTLAGAPTCPCTGPVTSNIITVKPKPTLPNIISDTITCGGSTTLVATVPFGNPVGIYKWYNQNDAFLFAGNGFTTPNLSSSVNYKVSYEANGCESDKRIVTVLVNPIPAPQLSVDTVKMNCNNSVTLTATPSAGATIEWYDDAATSILLSVGSQFTTGSLATTKDYYVINHIGNCKSTSKKVVAQVFNTKPPIVRNASFCVGDQATLTANHDVGNLNQGLFEWYDKNGNYLSQGVSYTLPPSVLSSAQQKVYNVLENINGCKSSFAIQNVQINAAPFFTVDTDFVKVCEGKSFQLVASPVLGNNYEWHTPSGGNVLSNSVSVLSASKANDEGRYVIKAKDASTSCESTSKEVTVQVIAKPSIGLLPTYTINDGETLLLLASGGDTYTWEPKEYFSDFTIPNPLLKNYPKLTENRSEVFSITVKTTDLETGCEAEAQSQVTVVPNANGLKVYNVITPNGDGQNDVWYIDYLYLLPDYRIMVFDAKNNLVFNCNSETLKYDDNRWNGKVNNSSSQTVGTSTFNYVIESSMFKEPLRGYINVLAN